MKRIQRKGYGDYSWKNNSNAVIVHRPSKFGNPYKLTEYCLDESLRLYEIWLREQLRKDIHFLDELKGKDLVCFCPVSSTDKITCHADILIRYTESLL